MDLFAPDPDIESSSCGARAGKTAAAALVASTLRAQAAGQLTRPFQIVPLLTATKAGAAVLTNDRDHYDLLQQLCPEGRFIAY